MSKPLNIDELRRGFKIPEDEDRDSVLQSGRDPNTPKKPIWKNCGCLIGGFIVVFIVFPFLWTLITGGSDEMEYDDMRIAFFQDDIKSANSNPTLESDSLSYIVKACVELTLEGLDGTTIKYYTKINEEKILVILKVDGMKKIEASSRKELVFAVESCLDDLLKLDSYEQYIAVDGRWNLLLTKSPHGADLKGKFASNDAILPFYGDEVIEQDSLRLKPVE